jgi:hypothetical protein
MSDQDWCKEALFETPHMKEQIQKPMEIVHPPTEEPGRVTPLPVPEQAQQELRVVLDDPLLAAALWQNVDAPGTSPTTPATTHQPDDAGTAVQMGMALYLLHALHFQGKPGHEHLVREEEQREEDNATK